MAGRRRGEVIAKGPGKWLIRFSLGTDGNGKRRSWTKTVHGTKKDAERALTSAQKDHDEGRLEDPSRMALSAWLSQWLEQKRSDLRERTWLHYGTLFRLYLNPALGAIRLADLKPWDVQKAITELSQGKHSEGRPLSATTVRDAVGRLRQALTAAVRLRLIPSNPALDAIPPKPVRRGPRRVLSAEGAARLARAADEDRDGALCLLALLTGLRPGEVLGLKWKDVDSTRGLLKVRRSLWTRRGGPLELTPPKNASSVRDVPLVPQALALLRRHKARQNAERLAAGPAYQDEGFLFTRLDGRPHDERSIGHSLARILRRAGLEHLSPHGLRHSAATLLILAGIDPAHVAAQLGHSSVKTTLDVYVKPSEERLRQGAELLSDLVFPNQDRSSDAR